MIDLLIFIVLICFFAYFHHYPTDQSNNAASTVLQMWTGSCNLSCRQSGYSRFSGMSGLNQPPPLSTPETPAGEEFQRNIAERVTNTALNCACRLCPCGHIESIIRTCRPATDIYVRNMELLGIYLSASFELISDTYEKFTNAMQCGTSCQRQAEYVRAPKDWIFESSENLTFDRAKTEGKKNKTLFPKKSEKLQLKARSEAAMKGRSGTAVDKETIEMVKKAEGSLKHNQNSLPPKSDNAGPSQQAEVCPTAQVRADDMPECGSCPRCLEEGKVCISKCPNTQRE